MSAVVDAWQATQRAERAAGLVLPLWPTAWAAVLVAALWLRLGALDAVPLAPDEAARALEARAIGRGTATDYTSAPLVTNLIFIWTMLFTDADGPVRVPSALAGWALCLTPLLYRRWLGNIGALLAGGLLAVSPLGVLASRSAHPAALAMLATAVGVGCLLQALERSDGRWLVGVAMALAAGLATGPGVVGQLVAVAFAASIYPPMAGAIRLEARRWLPPAAAAGLITSALANTLLLTRPNGLQVGLIDPFGEWLASIGLSGASSAAGALLLLHELPLVVLAGWGVIGAVRTPVGRFLLLWVLAALVLAALRRPPDLAAWTGPVLPLALLGGLGAGRLGWLARGRRPAVWVTGLATLVPLVFLVFAINGNVNRNSPFTLAPLAIAAGGVVAVALLASNWLSLKELGAALGLVAAIGLLTLGVSFLTRLNFSGHERGGPALLGQAGRPELRQVEAQVRDWWRQDPKAPVRIDASLRPVLEWAVRDGPPIEWQSTMPETAERAILGGGMSGNRPPGRWVRLVVAERYPPAQEVNPLTFWRWLVLRQSLVRPEPHAILIAQ